MNTITINNRDNGDISVYQCISDFYTIELADIMQTIYGAFPDFNVFDDPKVMEFFNGIGVKYVVRGDLDNEGCFNLYTEEWD